MLFKVTEKDVKEENPDILSVPELAHLSDRNLKYIFLVYDYDSPFRKLPLEKRKERVALKVGFKLETSGKRFDKNARDIMKGSVSSINSAIKAFLELIYDEDKETYRSIVEFIEHIRDDLKKPSANINDAKRKMEIALKLPELLKTKQKLAQILSARDGDTQEDDMSTDESSLSALDMVNEGIIG